MIPIAVHSGANLVERHADCFRGKLHERQGSEEGADDEREGSHGWGRSLCSLYRTKRVTVKVKG